MSRYPSEPEAWREIAQRVDRLPSEQGYLCDQVGYLDGTYPAEVAPFDYGTALELPESIGDRMRDRIAAYVGDGYSAYPDAEGIESNAPALRPYRQSRVLAALWFALEAEAESKAARSARRPSAGGRQP